MVTSAQPDRAAPEIASGIRLVRVSHSYGERMDERQFRIRVAAAIAFGVVAILGFLFLPLMYLGLLVIAHGVFVLWWKRCHRRRQKNGPLLRDVPEVISSGSAESDRFVCFGQLSELKPLRAIRNEQFEPFVARFFGPWYRYLLIGGIFASCAGMLVARELGIVDWAAFMLGIAFVFAIVLVLRIETRFWRVTPGRLELLQFPLFGEHGRVIESIDLRDARIECRYDQAKLSIRDSDGTAGSCTVDIFAVHPRHEFVEHVFRAAIVKPTDARLPSDQLLG